MDRLRHGFFACVLLVGACSSSTSVGDDAGPIGASDAGARDAEPDARFDAGGGDDDAGAMRCDDVRAAGELLDPTPPPVPACDADADCTEGRNGRCNSRSGSPARCTYDECVRDGECAGGELCHCDVGTFGENVCRPSNCVVDGDCSSGACSGTLGDCGDYFGEIGSYCHDADDECEVDADCDPSSGGRPYCKFDPVVDHWVCADTHCVG